MNQFKVLTTLVFLLALASPFKYNASTVHAFSNGSVFEQVTLTINNNANRADNPPEETFFPANQPFYPVPLSLTPHDHFLLLRPINNETVTWRPADYRYGYLVKKNGNVHTGLDIPAPEKTPVLAVADGTVIFSGYGLLYGEGRKNDPYGIAVMIRHDMTFDGNSLYSVYTHLEKSLVKVNDIVKAGQKIGGVGMTGNTSGPHLHFEVRIRDENGMTQQNAEMWLVPPMDHGVLAGRITNNLGYLLNNWNFRLTSLDTGNEWQLRTYDKSVVEEHLHDPYFQENFVLSDLPAGRYELFTYYNYLAYRYEFEIVPGAVNYINFLGKQGFVLGDPPGSQNTDFLN